MTRRLTNWRMPVPDTRIFHVSWSYSKTYRNISEWFLPSGCSHRLPASCLHCARSMAEQWILRNIFQLVQPWKSPAVIIFNRAHSILQHLLFSLSVFPTTRGLFSEKEILIVSRSKERETCFSMFFPTMADRLISTPSKGIECSISQCYSLPSLNGYIYIYILAAARSKRKLRGEKKNARNFKFIIDCENVSIPSNV